jgi:hypothetical protein
MEVFTLEEPLEAGCYVLKLLFTSMTEVSLSLGAIWCRLLYMWLE